MAKKAKIIPKLNGPLIETHCHLDYLKDQPLPDILALAQEYGVEKFITISVAPNNFEKVLELVETYSFVYGTQGIHPHNAKDSSDEAIQFVKSKLSHPKILAVGEIGLDYHYSKSPHDIQKEVFRTHLELAIEHDLPVVIHSRDADEDMIQILKELGPDLKKKGVIHSFTSGPELAQTALELGFYLGFNGIITFNNAENVRDIVRMCTLEQILLETDSPFLTPTPFRGKENNPSYLPLVAQKISEIKEAKVEDTLSICYQNSQNLFSIP